MGPHPHDLYLAPLALGVFSCIEPLRDRFRRLEHHDRDCNLWLLGVVIDNDPRRDQNNSVRRRADNPSRAACRSRLLLQA
jgi:hypothetical protein